jgi:adenylate cyclase
VSGPVRPQPELVARVRRRLLWTGLISSAIGSIVVFTLIGFLIPVFIDAGDRADLAARNGPLLVGYFVVAWLLVRRHLDRHDEATLEWLVEGRPPTVEEHHRTMRLAVEGAKVAALAWAAAGLLFAAVNALWHSWEFAAVTAATIWAGSETTCALMYLACERVLRPITACALAIRPTPSGVAPGIRGRFVFAWLLGTGVPLLGVLVVGTVGLARADVDLRYVAAAVVFLGVVATVAGLLATIFAAKAVAEPVTSVRKGLERVEAGDLDVHVAVDDGSEVGLLQAGFNRMADGLRDRERIRDLFGRQVGEEVARAALDQGTRLGGEEREVGALYIDLVGSTSMAMAMPPTEVVRVLNRFFRVVVEAVEEDGGLVNKFEGDAALCVFGAPVPSDDPAGAALRCARRMAARLATDVPEVDFGVGVSAGVAVAGNVGAERRFEYTVIGDPVNEAARLADLAKDRPERLLASAASLERARGVEREAWAGADTVMLRGRGTPTPIARPRAPAGPPGWG